MFCRLIAESTIIKLAICMLSLVSSYCFFNKAENLIFISTDKYSDLPVQRCWVCKKKWTEPALTEEIAESQLEESKTNNHVICECCLLDKLKEEKIGIFQVNCKICSKMIAFKSIVEYIKTALLIRCFSAEHRSTLVDRLFFDVMSNVCESIFMFTLDITDTADLNLIIEYCKSKYTEVPSTNDTDDETCDNNFILKIRINEMATKLEIIKKKLDLIKCGVHAKKSNKRAPSVGRPRKPKNGRIVRKVNKDIEVKGNYKDLYIESTTFKEKREFRKDILEYLNHANYICSNYGSTIKMGECFIYAKVMYFMSTDKLCTEEMIGYLLPFILNDIKNKSQVLDRYIDTFLDGFDDKNHFNSLVIESKFSNGHTTIPDHINPIFNDYFDTEQGYTNSKFLDLIIRVVGRLVSDIALSTDAGNSAPVHGCNLLIANLPTFVFQPSSSENLPALAENQNLKKTQESIRSFEDFIRSTMERKCYKTSGFTFDDLLKIQHSIRKYPKFRNIFVTLQANAIAELEKKRTEMYALIVEQINEICSNKTFSLVEDTILLLKSITTRKEKIYQFFSEISEKCRSEDDAIQSFYLRRHCIHLISRDEDVHLYFLSMFKMNVTLYVTYLYALSMDLLLKFRKFNKTENLMDFFSAKMLKTLKIYKKTFVEFEKKFKKNIFTLINNDLNLWVLYAFSGYYNVCVASMSISLNLEELKEYIVDVPVLTKEQYLLVFKALCNHKYHTCNYIQTCTSDNLSCASDYKLILEPVIQNLFLFVYNNPHLRDGSSTDTLDCTLKEMIVCLLDYKIASLSMIYQIFLIFENKHYIALEKRYLRQLYRRMKVEPSDNNLDATNALVGDICEKYYKFTRNKLVVSSDQNPCTVEIGSIEAMSQRIIERNESAITNGRVVLKAIFDRLSETGFDIERYLSVFEAKIFPIVMDVVDITIFNTGQQYLQKECMDIIKLQILEVLTQTITDY